MTDIVERLKFLSYPEAGEAVDEIESLREAAEQAERHLRALVSHWNEFGPDHGIGEMFDHADNWLRNLPAPPTCGKDEQ